MILTATTTSKVCAPITIVRVLKTWHWNNSYWNNPPAHSWKTGCLRLSIHVSCMQVPALSSSIYHIYVIRCTLRIMTEWGSSSRTADLHFWSMKFKLWLRYRLSRLRIFLSPSRQMLGYYLKFNNSTSLYTLSHSHSSSSTKPILYNPSYWKCC
jgi:hypothetical protein